MVLTPKKQENWPRRKLNGLLTSPSDTVRCIAVFSAAQSPQLWAANSFPRPGKALCPCGGLKAKIFRFSNAQKKSMREKGTLSWTGGNSCSFLGEQRTPSEAAGAGQRHLATQNIAQTLLLLQKAGRALSFRLSPPYSPPAQRRTSCSVRQKRVSDARFRVKLGIGPEKVISSLKIEI